MKKCLVCGEEIARHRSAKYCDDGCGLVAYHARYGEVRYKKKCECGCGGWMISKDANNPNKYKRGHLPAHLRKLDCELCGDSVDKLHEYQLTDFGLKLCIKCYEKIFDLSMEEN